MQHRALALRDQQRRLVLLGMMQRVNEIAPIDLEQLCRAIHDALLVRRGDDEKQTTYAPAQRRGNGRGGSAVAHGGRKADPVEGRAHIRARYETHSKNSLFQRLNSSAWGSSPKW